MKPNPLFIILLLAGLFPKQLQADIPQMAFLQVRITLSDSKEILRYLEIPAYAFSMDSILDDDRYALGKLTAWSGNGLEVFRHMIAFTGVIGFWDTIPKTIYGVSESELVPIHDVKSLHVERVEFNGGGQGIYNALTSEASIWMRKKPLRVIAAGANNYEFTIFQFEKDRKLDAFILDFIVRGQDATRKQQDVDMSAMLERIKRKHVVIVWRGTC